MNLDFNHGYQAYQAWKFDKAAIRLRFEQTMAALPKAVVEYGIEGIVVCGTSGSWLAASLVMAQDLPVILVRKASDLHHGYNVEGRINKEYPRFLFVDDFVDSGDTLKHVKEQIKQRGGKVVAYYSHEHDTITKVLA